MPKLSTSDRLRTIFPKALRIECSVRKYPNTFRQYVLPFHDVPESAAFLRDLLNVVIIASLAGLPVGFPWHKLEMIDPWVPEPDDLQLTLLTAERHSLILEFIEGQAKKQLFHVRPIIDGYTKTQILEHLKTLSNLSLITIKFTY